MPTTEEAPPTDDSDRNEVPADPFAGATDRELARLAAEVERRQADGGRKDVPAADLEPSEEFKARVAGLMAAVPRHPDEDEEPVDDVTELRTRTFAAAWANSLHAARVDDLAHFTFDKLAPDQWPSKLRGFVDNIGPDTPVQTLVLAGRVGAGKTAAAIAAGNAAAQRGLLVRFVKHGTYLAMLRPDGSPVDMPMWQIRRRFRDCRLLVLDDLGAELDPDEPATRFVREETLGLVSDRIESGRFTIVTTNESSSRLYYMLGERLLSRLSQRGHAVEFTGQDRRGRLSWG